MKNKPPQTPSQVLPQKNEGKEYPQGILDGLDKIDEALAPHDAAIEKIFEAQKKAIYGKEILNSSMGKRAVALLEKMLAANNLVSTSFRLIPQERGKVLTDNPHILFEILETIACKEENELPEGKANRHSPFERGAFMVGDSWREFIKALGKESEMFWEYFGKACTKRRSPKSIHRAAIIQILGMYQIEKKKLALMKVSPLQAQAAANLELPPLDTDTLFDAFKKGLHLDDSTPKKNRAIYTSFMRTLKEMEEEKLIPRLQRAKTGKKTS